MARERTELKPESGNHDEHWRDLLTGSPSTLPAIARLFNRLPAAPRCKACHVPFAGPFAPILRLLKWRPWRLNEQLCHWCFEGMRTMRGGADVPVSLLFTDVRGSTTIAETMPAPEFRALLDRFYGKVFAAVDAHNGVIDHIVGDGVMALWTPAFGGPDHPRLALEAGRQLMSALAEDEELSRLPAGVGVHTGTAWVGVVGERGAHDFTVLGDAPNTVARLGSVAAGGELLISEAVVEAVNADKTHLEHRDLDLKGKAEPFPAWMEPVQH